MPGRTRCAHPAAGRSPRARPASKLASADLAVSRGPCPAIGGGLSRYANPAFLTRFAGLGASTVTDAEWTTLAERIAADGMLRNSSTIALPPTGRSAPVIGASTGIEPLFRLTDPHHPDFLHPAARPVLAETGGDGLIREVTRHGRLPAGGPVGDSVRDVLAVATQIQPSGHLAMVSAIQSCVDEAVGKILLMRRAGTDYGEGHLAFHAGHVDLGETPSASIIRETAEELGIGITPAALMPAGVMFRRSLEPRVDFFFAADAWEGIPQICEPHKCTELAWADPGDLPPGTLDYVGAAIANVSRGHHFCEHGWEPTFP